jgi:3',5'-cyclic AMP phosphodiesterase CpdA
MPLLAHLSDLHLGRSPLEEQAAARLVAALVEARVDQVVVTGDVTHRGRREELDRFRALFRPLESRLTVVPGNHDRLGDDVSSHLMAGPRVQVQLADGLWLVRLDSTGPHNRALLAAHGTLDAATMEAVAEAVAAAPRDRLVVLALHHHLLSLPEETWPERLSAHLGWPNAQELPLGRALLARLAGRCDLVLHGHRHVPCAVAAPDAARGRERPLAIYNAGSSTELLRARLFPHLDGALLGAPSWLAPGGLLLDVASPPRGLRALAGP